MSRKKLVKIDEKNAFVAEISEGKLKGIRSIKCVH